MNSPPFCSQHYLVSAGAGKAVCEDHIGMFGNVYWTVDGASLPAALAGRAHPTTQRYVETLGLELATTVYQAPDAPLDHILREAIVGVKARTREQSAGEAAIFPSSTVVLVRINNYDLEYLVLGDSYLVIDMPPQLECISDQRIRRVVPSLREAFQHSQETSDSSDAWIGLVLQELASRNQPEGYWIAADDPDAVGQALVGRRSLVPGSRLLAMTDGFAAAVEVLGLYEDWARLVQTAVQDGLDTILERLRAAEIRQAARRSGMRGGMSDDASALLIEWRP